MKCKIAYGDNGLYNTYFVWHGQLNVFQFRENIPFRKKKPLLLVIFRTEYVL